MCNHVERYEPILKNQQAEITRLTQLCKERFESREKYRNALQRIMDLDTEVCTLVSARKIIEDVFGDKK